MYNFLFMQRFYWPHSALNGIVSLVIDYKLHADTFHQLVHVLRIAIDTDVSFFAAGDSVDHIFKLAGQDKKQLTFTYQAQKQNSPELPFQLILAQAIPQKSEKWEWILQKGTELGVHTFIPLITERTQKHQLPKMERMQKILIEASEQCGRGSIPQIALPIAMATWHPNQATLFASLIGQQKLSALLQTLLYDGSITCVVGPEGGFSAKEEQYLLEQKAQPFTLGNTVLRLETAAIVSLGIISQLGQ